MRKKILSIVIGVPLILSSQTIFLQSKKINNSNVEMNDYQFDDLTSKNSVGIDQLNVSVSNVSSMIVTKNDGSDSLYIWGDLSKINTSLSSSSEPIEIYNTLNGYLLGDSDLIRHGSETKVKYFENSSDFCGLVITDQNVDYLYMWGNYSNGQLGYENIESGWNYYVPFEIYNTKSGYYNDSTLMMTGSDVTIQFYGQGTDHNLIVLENTNTKEQIVYTWGSGLFGQLGDSDSVVNDTMNGTYIDEWFEYDNSNQTFGDIHYYTSTPYKMYSTKDGYFGHDSYTGINSSDYHMNKGGDTYIKEISVGQRQNLMTISSDNIDYIYGWGQNNEYQTSPGLQVDYKINSSSSGVYSGLDNSSIRVSVPYSFYNTNDGLTTIYSESGVILNEPSFTIDENDGFIDLLVPKVKKGQYDFLDAAGDVEDSINTDGSFDGYFTPIDGNKRTVKDGLSILSTSFNSSSTYEIENIESSSKTSYFVISETTSTGEIIQHLYGMGDNDNSTIGSEFDHEHYDNIAIPIEIYNTHDGYVVDFVNVGATIDKENTSGNYSVENRWNDGIVDEPTSMPISNDDVTIDIIDVQNNGIDDENYIETTEKSTSVGLQLRETNNETGETKDYLYGWGSTYKAQLGNVENPSSDIYNMKENYSANPSLIFETEVNEAIKEYFYGRSSGSGLVSTDFSFDHLYMWGDNSYGQLGVSSSNDLVGLPNEVEFAPTLKEDSIKISGSGFTINIEFDVNDKFDVFIPENVKFKINGDIYSNEDFTYKDNKYKINFNKNNQTYVLNSIIFGSIEYNLSEYLSYKTPKDLTTLWIILILLIVLTILIIVSIIWVFYSKSQIKKYGKELDELLNSDPNMIE